MSAADVRRRGRGQSGATESSFSLFARIIPKSPEPVFVFNWIYAILIGAGSPGDFSI